MIELPKRIRILLANYPALFRTSLRYWLESQADLELVALASNGPDAVHIVATLQIDVVVLGPTLPQLNGVETTRRILKENPETRVIAVAADHDRAAVGRMLHAGAVGYLFKTSGLHELGRAIRAQGTTRLFLSPGVADVLVEDYVRPSASVPAAALTEREREVLQLLSEGHSNKEAAARLCVSDKTVGTHRQHIMRKLGLENVPALTRYALREGLTSLDS